MGNSEIDAQLRLVQSFEARPERFFRSIATYNASLKLPADQAKFLNLAMDYLKQELEKEPHAYELEWNEDGTAKVDQEGNPVYSQTPSERFLLLSDVLTDVETLYNSLPPQEKEPAAQDTDKIQWLGTEPQLVYLFELLFQADLIPLELREKRFSVIARHFKNRDGRGFSNKQLSQAQRNYENNAEGKPKGADKLDEIADELKRLRGNSDI